MRPERDDVEALVREKHSGDREAPGVAEDLARLAAGEPLAYVIGDQPFLGLSISLGSRPLIPRPETEWWAELLCERIGDEPFRVLDLCAGSGAVGLAVLKQCRNARVSFGELVPEHAETIRKNVEQNGLDASRADIRSGDLFAPFEGEQFDIIAANPPYIPEGRALDGSVTDYEPGEALFSGPDGLSVIRRIAAGAAASAPELWMECDESNADQAARLCLEADARRADVRIDQYERPRLVVSYW